MATAAAARSALPPPTRLPPRTAIARATGTLTSATLFVDLETTGLSGGAGTVAFLVGCGWFDMGAFQVRQFLLTSYASERALLDAVAELLRRRALLVTYNGKTFDVPVMETRWMFHRMRMPLESVRHFDMLHPGAAAVARTQAATAPADARRGGCRLARSSACCATSRASATCPGSRFPGRYFQFLRSGDARPLEPVLEHNRLDLISLAAVAAHARAAVRGGHAALPRCRGSAGAGEGLRARRLRRSRDARATAARADDRVRARATCERKRSTGSACGCAAIAASRKRRTCWRRLLELPKPARPMRRIGSELLGAAAAVRRRGARDSPRAPRARLSRARRSSRCCCWRRRRTGVAAGQRRHRLARLERKIARKDRRQLFGAERQHSER